FYIWKIDLRKILKSLRQCALINGPELKSVALTVVEYAPKAAHDPGLMQENSLSVGPEGVNRTCQCRVALRGFNQVHHPVHFTWGGIAKDRGTLSSECETFNFWVILIRGAGHQGGHEQDGRRAVHRSLVLVFYT